MVDDYDKGLKYGKEALVLAKSILFEKGLGWDKWSASAYNNIGNIYFDRLDYNEALKNYFVSLHINEALKNKKDIAGAYLNIGIIYYYQNNYPEALKYYTEALHKREDIGDQQGIANSYNDIGLVYDNPDNYPKALKNYFAALMIYEEIADKPNIAGSYISIGRIYNSQGNYPEALKMYFSSLKINESIDDKSAIALSYTAIGNVYWDQVNYPQDLSQGKSSISMNPGESSDLINKALENYCASLKISQEISDEQGIVKSFINIANVQIDLNKPKEAREYLNKALLLSKEINSKEWIRETYGHLVDMDSTEGNWKMAYKDYSQYILYRDSIDTEVAMKKSLQSAKNKNLEKMEALDKAAQDKKDAVTAAETKVQKSSNELIVVVLLLLLICAALIFRSRKSVKK